MSASQTIKNEIKKCFGVGKTDARYIEINSALVSAQNRRRFYVYNCGDVGQPEDRKIIFWRDVKETNYEKCKPYKVNRTPSRENMWKNGHAKNTNSGCINITYAKKSNTLTTKQDRQNNAGLIKFEDFCRFLTVEECCRLQTLPDDYCRTVSKTQAYKALGNGWTAEVIIHILNGALKDVPRDEKIVVLSMYDGIGTGRYCLDKMGFKYVKYYAYEIDKYAIQIALSNYPDIIELGDAYQIKNLIVNNIML